MKVFTYTPQRISLTEASLSGVVLSVAVLVLADFGVEEQSLVGEGLTGACGSSAGVAGEALRQCIKQRGIVAVVVAVEVQIEDAAGAGHRAGAGGARRALVRGVPQKSFGSNRYFA